MDTKNAGLSIETYYFGAIFHEKWFAKQKITLQYQSVWKQRLTTVDLHHFVWNIGELLGGKNDYSGYVRADFIKSMFLKIFMNMNLDSIRNFKFQPNKCSIVIDEPDENGNSKEWTCQYFQSVNHIG